MWRTADTQGDMSFRCMTQWFNLFMCDVALNSSVAPIHQFRTLLSASDCSCADPFMPVAHSFGNWRSVLPTPLRPFHLCPNSLLSVQICSLLSTSFERISLCCIMVKYIVNGSWSVLSSSHAFMKSLTLTQTWCQVRTTALDKPPWKHLAKYFTNENTGQNIFYLSPIASKRTPKKSVKEKTLNKD